MTNLLMHLMSYLFNKAYFNNMNYKSDRYKLTLTKSGINVFKRIKCPPFLILLQIYQPCMPKYEL